MLVNDTYNIRKQLLLINFAIVNVAHITILTMFEFVSNKLLCVSSRQLLQQSQWL